MNCLEQHSISCPYCGESFDVLIDCTQDEQSYVEDCAVCCQPVVLAIYVDTSLHVTAQREND